MSRILVVDDMPFMRALLKDILLSGGHTIVGEAENGEEAIEKYREFHPDLVTMDVVMPKKNGIDALKGIKAIDPNANVVMFTAVGQEQMIDLAARNGASGYVVKPFRASQIIEKVNGVLDDGGDPMVHHRWFTSRSGDSEHVPQ